MADVFTTVAALRAQQQDSPGTGAVQVTGTGGLWLLLDSERQLHLCIRQDGTHLPEPLEHVRVTGKAVRLGPQMQNVVDVSCTERTLDGVFLHFLNALALRAAAGGSPVQALTAELAAWRSFLAVPPGPPGTDRCAETVGELLVARDLCHHNPAAAAAWVGDRHDFRAGSTAVEVKTTRSATGLTITVHGAEQLQPPKENGTPGILFLHFVRLEHTPGVTDGVSVHSLADDLIAAGVPTELVWQGLGRHSIAPAQIEATAAITFQIRQRLTVPVDDTVPRIVPENFVDGAVPAGVDNLTYSTSLSAALDHALDEQQWSQLVTRIADASGTTP